MALVVDVPYEKLRPADEVSDEWRCEYAFAGVRCVRRRVQENYKFCDVHDRWEQTAMATLGAPLPVDGLSTQLFLAMALHEVMGQRQRRTDAEIQAIMTLAKLMAKNAGYL